MERDVRQLINIGNQNSFEHFIKLLAGRVGQLVNLNSLAGYVGVSQTTLTSWISVLEASFIVFRDGIVPIEIKSSASFDLSFSKNIQQFANFSEKIKDGYVVYGGDKNFETEHATFLNFRDVASVV